MKAHPFHRHPGVRTGDQLTRSERAADRMKSALATWSALFAMVGFMAVWVISGGFGADPFPYILLNLCLSTLAGLQCFVLLIANRRGEQIAAELALHDHEMLTEMRRLTRCLHASPDTGPCSCERTADA